MFSQMSSPVFLEKSKKGLVSLSSAELAKRAVKVNVYLFQWILTSSLQKSTALLTSLEERTLVGDKLVKNDAGEMSVSEDSKQKACLEHYQRLLSVEFD